MTLLGWALILLTQLPSGVQVERVGVYETRMECEQARPVEHSVCIEMKGA
jgi:hypothetical protein